MQLIHESLSMRKRKHKSVSKWYRDSKFIKGFLFCFVFGSYLLEEGRTKISSLALLFLLGWERMSALLVPCYCSVLTNSIRRRADFLWRTAMCGGKTLYPSPPPNPLDNLWITDQGHQWWPSEGNTGLLNSRRKRGVGEWAAVSPTVLCPADTAKVPYPFCSHSSPLPKVSLNTWQTLRGGKDSLRPNLERS